MKQNLTQIILPSTPLKINRKNKSIDTEILYGESFSVYYSKGKFSYGISFEDKYEGWVASNSLGRLTNSTHIVSSIRSCVLTEPDVKAELIFFLSMRSKINVIEITENWAKISLPHKSSVKFGYILKSHIIENSDVKLDWVKYAESFLGTPYRWGGRNSIGIDCSALLQLSKSFVKVRLPRDTKDQLNFFLNSKKYKIFEINKNILFNRGNIIFWEGHVAILVDHLKLIHASGFHGKVLTENIKKTMRRIKGSAYYVVDRIN